MKSLILSERGPEIYRFIPILGDYTIVKSGTRSEEHYHNVYHLVFVLGGSGLLINDSGRFKLEKGHIILINPGEKHIFRGQTSDLRYFACNFCLLDLKSRPASGARLDVHSREVERMGSYFPLQDILNLDLDRIYLKYPGTNWPRILTMISGYYHRSDPCHNVLTAPSDKDLMTTFELELFHFLRTFLQFLTARSTQEMKSDTLSERIREYLSRHLSEKLDLKALAGELDYNPCYLSHHFKVKNRISINDYHNRERIEKGCRMLSATNKSILDIAMELGYCSSEHFIRYFRKFKQQTPRLYRDGARLV